MIQQYKSYDHVDSREGGPGIGKGRWECVHERDDGRNHEILQGLCNSFLNFNTVLHSVFLDVAIRESRKSDDEHKINKSQYNYYCWYWCMKHWFYRHVTIAIVNKPPICWNIGQGAYSQCYYPRHSNVGNYNLPLQLGRAILDKYIHHDGIEGSAWKYL